MLSEMLGPKGVAFDNDEVLDENDDEDLKNDPISQMDMAVRRVHSNSSAHIDPSALQSHLIAFFKECASRNTNNFSTIFDQLTIEEKLDSEAGYWGVMVVLVRLSASLNSFLTHIPFPHRPLLCVLDVHDARPSIDVWTVRNDRPGLASFRWYACPF